MKYLKFLPLALLLFSSCAEKNVSEVLYDDYNEKDGFSILILPPSFVDNFVSDDENDQKDLLKTIDDFRLMFFSSAIEVEGGIETVRKDINKLLDGRGFETYMSINKDGSDIMVKGRGEEDKVKEMHVLIAGENQIILASLTGKINLSKALSTINDIDGSDFDGIEEFSSGFDFDEIKWAF